MTRGLNPFGWNDFGAEDIVILVHATATSSRANA
jgi:hypothetical protein